MFCFTHYLNLFLLHYLLSAAVIRFGNYREEFPRFKRTSTTYGICFYTHVFSSHSGKPNETTKISIVQAQRF